MQAFTTLTLSIGQELNIFNTTLLFLLNSKREKTSYTQEPTHSNMLDTGKVSSAGTIGKLGKILVVGLKIS